jgi:hypothetical protein
MRYLAVIRHGEFNEGEAKLNEKGKEQIRSLIPSLRDLNFKIYSSLGPRSIESATILAEGLGTSISPMEIFGDMNQLEKAAEFIAAQKENVVIVTKGEFANPLVSLFLRQYLRQAINLAPMAKGEGILIDVESKTYDTLFT